MCKALDLVPYQQTDHQNHHARGCLLEAFTCVNIHLLAWNGMFLMSLPSESVVQSSIRLWMSKAGGSLTPQSSAMAPPCPSLGLHVQGHCHPLLLLLHASFSSLKFSSSEF